MKIKKLSIKIPNSISTNFLFYFSFVIYVFTSILTTSFYAEYIIGRLYKLILLFCIMLLALKEFTTFKFNKKIAAAISICLLCIAIVFMTADMTPLLIFICFIAFIYSCRNQDLRKVVLTSIIVTSITVLIIIVSAKLGIIKNVIGAERDVFGANLFDNGSGRVRTYLGFRYALYPSAYLFNITALTIYYYRHRIKWLTLAILVIANYWIYIKTISRLSFYTSILLIAVAVFLKIFPGFLEKRKILQYLMVFSFIIFALISFLLVLKYDSSIKWMAKLDDILGTRLSLANESLNTYGVKIFGENIPWQGWGFDANGERTTNNVTYLFVDCMYIQVLQRYGYIFFAIMISMLTLTQYKLKKQNNYYLMIVFSFIAMRSFFDDLYFYLHYNTFWLIIGMALIGSMPKVLPYKVRKILERIGIKE